MSEQMIVRNWATGFRACLLANVSSLALLGWVGMTDGALAASAGEDHPVVWIELGGEFDRPAGGSEIFSPPFFDQASPADRAVLTGVQQPALYSEALDGKIIFTPRKFGLGSFGRGPDGALQYLQDFASPNSGEGAHSF